MTSVTVAIVGICSATHIGRCLAAVAAQEGAPPFDVIVVHDPHIEGIVDLASRFPDVRFLANAGQRTPLELAARAVGAASGELVLLTEDHCIPRQDWVRTMAAAVAPGRAVIGGRVEIGPTASATDWAFYFVDFFRYAAPVDGGPSPSLTVCNACYRRADLAAVESLWRTDFHETAIHDALRARGGVLWLEPMSEVTMSRHVSLGDALYERYAFGRLFSCTRIRFVGRGRRLLYAVLSPALPALLLGRMAAKAARSPALAASFLRSFLALAGMVLTWSWGEWLGYVTGRHPRSLVVAPEIRSARREAAAR